MITYELSLRDNIENFNITGSIIYPYYPPTATAFSASIENNTYIIQTDSSSFVGWNVNRSTDGIVYRTVNGRIITISRNKQSLFEPVLEYPPGIGTEFIASSQTLKFPLFQYRSDNLTTFTPQFVAEILTEFEKEQTNRTGTRPTIYKTADIIPASGSLQPPTNGFRIKTAGYTDLIIFAEDSAGNRRVPTQEGIIDMGTFTLIRSEADAQKDIDSFQQVDSKTILKNTPQAEKPKGLNNLAQLLTQKSTTLKTILLTAIVPQITQFGISNIKELLEQEGNLDELLSKLPIKCPTPDKIQQLIVLRNKYTTQLNTFFESISRLSQSLTGSTQVSEALTTGLAVVSASRKAANIALGLLPVTPGAAPSAINLLKDLEDTIGPILTKISRTLGILTSTVAFVVGIISTIIQLLNLLDGLIFLCAQREGIPYEAINAELATLNNKIISDLQNSSQTQDNSYKGFKFELVLDTSVNFSYPKRYAVAKDKYGVILLKSQSSFTPNPNILIEELKFIIDRDNLSGE